MDTEKNTEKESLNLVERIISFVVLNLLSIGLIYFGGWDIVMGEKSSLFSYLTQNKGFVIAEECVLLRVNKSYYGFIENEAFFDSPILQWLMLIVGILAFLAALQMLIFGKILSNSDD